MPEMRYYVVKQTREVKVTANSAADAAQIAGYAFEHGQNSDNGVHSAHPSVAPQSHPLNGIWGNTTTKIRETSLYIDEGVR